jgi:xanthine dehydrogenase YagR molybdenum-binding subunit
MIRESWYYTIMAQVAADMLGLPLDSVSIKLGDSSLRHSPVEGGSWTATSVLHARAREHHLPRGPDSK